MCSSDAAATLGPIIIGLSSISIDRLILIVACVPRMVCGEELEGGRCPPNVATRSSCLLATTACILPVPFKTVHGGRQA